MTLASTHHESDELGGGQFHDEFHLKPIAYDRAGSRRRIMNVLGATGDPNMSVGVDELVQFRLDPRLAGKSPLFYFGKGQSRVTMALLNANNVSGVVSGNSVRFANAWNGADLTYQIGGHRLQESITLRAGHPRTFLFRIDEHAGFDPVTLMFGNDFRILQPTLDPPSGGPALSVPLTWVVTQQGGHWVLSVTLPDGDWTGWTIDPTLSLQPGAADGLDTLINQPVPNGNYGTLTDIGIGEDNRGGPNHVQRALIKFNLASLPDTALISSAVLSLTIEYDFADNGDTYRVYRQKRAWVEGTGFVTNPATDGSTWNKYDVANNLSWQAAGGFGSDDCEQTAIGSITLTATEAIGAVENISLTPTTKAALDLGNGWLLKGDTELNDMYVYYSSDHATAAYRPKLVVEYSVATAVKLQHLRQGTRQGMRSG